MLRTYHLVLPELLVVPALFRIALAIMFLLLLGSLHPLEQKNIFNKQMAKLTEFLNSSRPLCLFHSFIHSFIHLTKYLLNTYYIPGTILGTGMWQ